MASVCDCTDAPVVSAGCICRSGADAIRALTMIRRALAGTYPPAGIRVWMHASNARFQGRSPMSLVMAGRGQDVVDEARRLGAS
jgi:hypothetical protein